MSWLISRALMEDYANSHSLPGLVAEYLEGTCSDGAPFAPSSGNPTPQAYLPPDKMTAFSRPSRFGMTFAPLTDDRGAELLTWYRGAFRARTSAPQALGLALTENAPVFGGKWRELSVRYDPASCSWRTHRSLWDEDLSECSLTLPKWGLMCAGVLSELLTLEHHTAANDAGLLPTPRATDWKNGKQRADFGMNLPTFAKKWPTPLATDGSKGGPNQKGGKGDLRLSSAVHQFPTPTATNTKAHHMRGADNGKEREARSYGETGQLNPTWVEWLMGWPLGWTDVKPLETDRCRSAQQRHGGF